MVLARQLAVRWRPGTREMHRTPGPESGCNKPEDRDSDRAVEAGKNRMDGPRRRVAPPAEGWLASWDVERVAGETVEGHLGESQERRIGASRFGARVAPRRGDQGHGGRGDDSHESSVGRDEEKPRRSGPVTGQGQGGCGEGQATRDSDRQRHFGVGVLEGRINLMEGGDIAQAVCAHSSSAETSEETPLG